MSYKQIIMKKAKTLPFAFISYLAFAVVFFFFFRDTEFSLFLFDLKNFHQHFL